MNKTSTPNKHEFIIFDDTVMGDSVVELFRSQQGARVDGDLSTVNTQGRGSVFMFEYGGFSLVLRHYCRGGMVRHFIKDSYWFSSLESTRMWQEFKLLQALESLNLPVAKAIAARCVKTSPITCRGDLLTEKVPNSQTLAQILMEKAIDDDIWQSLGCLLSRFHQNNVFHADLNANNILITDQDELFLIDFDRGEFRSESRQVTWKQDNLHRLLRSFRKLSKKYSNFHFSEAQWQLLINAYSSSRPSRKC